MIRFAEMEGRPVVWTETEAWWLVDGRWQPVEAASVHMGARVLSETSFRAKYPHLPPLPETT